MLLSIDLLVEFLDSINPDLIILQNITFANASYASEVLKRFECPLLLWTLREPVIDGGRLRLNSLTGAYSAANVIKAFREEPFEYIFGSPEEENVKKAVEVTVRASQLKNNMRELKLAAIGHTPQGFGFGRALDLEMLENFGVSLESLEVREFIDRAKSYTNEDCEEYLQDASNRMCGLDKIPENNRRDFARLLKSYKSYVEDHHIGAVASRCWPDFFTAYGTPVCGVLAMLNENGIAASCEADAYGALSIYMGMQLTGKPTFFGDPVSLDEQEGTITFWHCGTAACSLAREDSGAKVDVHCNRKIGPTLDFGCKACDKVTIFRIGKKADGKFRFFIAKGKALDKPKQFSGTSVVVKTEELAENIINSSVKEGWEPHFVVIYEDVAAELEVLAHMLNMEVCRY
jgi:L-fucose isomerase-like protein